MITKITQEHLDWWNALPKLWQRIFVNMLYYPETHYQENYWYNTNLNKDLTNHFILANEFGNQIDLIDDDKLRSSDDLLRLFQAQAIGYIVDFGASAHLCVKEIPPLHYFTQLKMLDLTHNCVNDLSGLKGLKNLEILIMHDNYGIDDISVLSELTSLKEIDFWGADINDISPLKNLVNLEYLYLIDCNITDISPLSNLTKLVDLDLGNNPIIDISPLAHLTQLKDLCIGSEDFYFDMSYVEWLKEQLPNCDIDVWEMLANDSDENFLNRVVWGRYRDNEDVVARMEKIASNDDKTLELLLNQALDCYNLREMRKMVQDSEYENFPALKNLNRALYPTWADNLIEQLKVLSQDSMYDNKRYYEKDKILEQLNKIDIENLNQFFGILRDMNLILKMRKWR